MNKKEKLNLAIALVNIEFARAVTNIKHPSDVEVDNGEAWHYILELLKSIKSKHKEIN